MKDTHHLRYATGLTGEKHFNQLNILVRLRNENINLKFKNMISVSSFYTIEKDARYLIGKEQGLEQGIEQGKEQGIEQGLKQGIEQGIEQGKEEGKRETAIRMKNLGYEPELIAKVLNLPIEKIQEFQKEFSN